MNEKSTLRRAIASLPERRRGRSANQDPAQEILSSTNDPVFLSERKRVNVHSFSGAANAALGWAGIVIALSVALWMGLWAFNGPAAPPPGFESYDSLPRRFLRLAHIAGVMLGALNILFARELPRLELSDTWRRRAGWLIAFALPGISLGCAAAAFLPSAKYLLPLGAVSGVVACTIAAVGASRSYLKEFRHA